MCGDRLGRSGGLRAAILARRAAILRRSEGRRRSGPWGHDLTEPFEQARRTQVISSTEASSPKEGSLLAENTDMAHRRAIDAPRHLGAPCLGGMKEAGE